MRLKISLFTVTAAALLLAACGSDTTTRAAGDDDRMTADTAVEAEDQVAADEAVRTYFDAVASNRASELTAAESVTEPDSPADLYRRYLLELNRTSSRSGTATYNDGTVTTCDPGQRDEGCARFSDIAVNENGKIVNFVSGDAPLTERIRGNGPAAEASGVSGRTSIAYRTQNEDLFLLVELTNSSGRPLSIYSFDSAYIVEGRQLPVEGVSSAGDIRPGATAVLTFAVPGGSFGGELDLDGTFTDSYDSFSLRVPTP